MKSGVMSGEVVAAEKARECWAWRRWEKVDESGAAGFCGWACQQMLGGRTPTFLHFTVEMHSFLCFCLVWCLLDGERSAWYDYPLTCSWASIATLHDGCGRHSRSSLIN